MEDNLFRILAAVIFLIGAAISIVHRRKAERAGAEKISLKEEGLWTVLFLRLAGLALWAVVFAFLIHPAWTSWSRLDLPTWARWLGVALGVAGDLLAWWVFTSLGNNVTPTVVTRANHSLVTSGPYRWVRHPLYLMGLISYLGFALLAENWFIGLLALAGFAGLAVRTAKEEDHLLARFGDEYERYRLRTGKFFPRLSR